MTFFTDSTKTTVVEQREGTSSFVSRFCEPPFACCLDFTWLGIDDPFDRFDAGSCGCYHSRYFDFYFEFVSGGGGRSA